MAECKFFVGIQKRQAVKIREPLRACSDRPKRHYVYRKYKAVIGL